MHFFCIYCHIGSMWLLMVDVKLWFMIFRLFYMSISIECYFKWTLLTPSTPFCVRPFSKNFGWQEVNYCKFSLLFVFFYVMESLLFFSHHFPSRDLSIILLFIDKNQGDSLIRPIFAFAHFCVLHCFFGVFLSCFFPSLADDTHILSLVSFISFSFDHFVF